MTNNISSELLIIYGLIGLVGLLIAIILKLDKKEKKRVNLLQTQELRIMDLRKCDDNYQEEYKKIEEIEETEDEIIINEIKKEEVNNDIESINIEVDEDMYVEDDLEKTQAQLHLEALTNELKKVQIEEEGKIQKFEEEQEENAIISYKELLKVCDQLYDSNEKVQYMDEGNEPITIDQLREKFNKNKQDIEVL